MKLQAYRLQNYRRLRDVVIELDDEISIFVGANNSGKTSAVQGLYSMLRGEAKKFELFDFSAALWAEIDAIGRTPPGDEDAPKQLPSILLDLWFRVGEDDLATAMSLLPSTEWDGKCVGIRVAFEPRDAHALVRKFHELHEKANNAATALMTRNTAATEAGTENVAAVIADPGEYKPWPESLTKYLTKELNKEYTFRYYVLDERAFVGYQAKEADYEPLPLGNEPGGGAILKSLVRVDFLRAQRHLDDPDAGSSDRAESLSRRLSRFYHRNLEKRSDDHAALKALDTSEKELNFHLEEVFSDTLKRLAKLGYPGVNNPEIVIRAALDPTTVLGQDAKIHYVVPGAVTAQLPDSYNGLGFKNLVYMVVELLDLHEQWKAEEDKRAPLHLVFIEEPEAHLHAQVQQVFIRNVLRLLEDANDHATFFHTQLVVTTHSPHILYERGFSPIRYFRRVSDQLDHNTEVRNLSLFKTGAADAPAREFLQRYLKLTHCDLFFSDAIILVEGNVERLLLPAMIELAAKRLRSSALTILEVGGAFAHRFQELIAFVGLTTLVITDLDSVTVKTDAEDAAEQDAGTGGNVDGDNEDDDLKTFELEDDEAAPGGKKKSKKRGSTCHAHVEGAVTSNQTLISWIPKKRSVAELWEVTAEQKTLSLAEGASAEVRVAYQTKVLVTVGATTSQLCGRTLEEAFGLENSDWCQAEANRAVGLKLKRAPNSPEELAEKLHERVIGKNFDKTRFALEVLASGPLNCWKVPTYIAEGLAWLEAKVAHEIEADTAIATEVATIEPTAAGVIAVIADAGQTI
ncbi:AAA ATPase-like protein [Pseudomonas protegens]|uniref:AAA family ATPase n=1 Tax=Pseudomonas TaxID=286 RepID=UPI000F4A7608|nr:MULTISPECIES: ATP-dependent endonuclease [Pseudomonas]MCS4259518.1 putative ATP-dependent endonuclease of OLD family [Pseudomonas sp. BIGb0176]ROQ56676.1 AAA ATPase-like protein [Pseudomonas protegens]ROQ85224.1 AAA ATPase-like protein [Pseudomonas protegens]